MACRTLCLGGGHFPGESHCREVSCMVSSEMTRAEPDLILPVFTLWEEGLESSSRIALPSNGGRPF